jgi:hypothetical protein
MSDRLYLSYWLKGFTEHNMVRHFEGALQRFPVSRLRPGALMQVQALEVSEPPLLEKETAEAGHLADLLDDARWFFKADCACEIESYWDLWRFDEEWKIKPATAMISCYGPLFPSELGEQIRISFGLDSQFLPQPDLSRNLAPVRHNIRSLLHLVNDLDEALAAEKRLLWSESGENFVERLQAALADE